MQIVLERPNVGRLLIPVAVGLVVGLAATPRPAVLCLWAIAVPWFIANKQGFSNGGMACAVAFALPACAVTLSKAIMAPDIVAAKFLFTALALSPLAAVLGILGLNLCGVFEKDDRSGAPYSWLGRVPSTAVHVDEFVESKSEGQTLR